MVIGLTTDLQIVGLRGSCHRQVCIQHNITRKVAVELTTQCAIRPWKLYVLFWQFNSEASCKEFSQHSCWSRCPTGDVGGSCGQSWTPWSAHHLLNTPIWKHTGGSHLRTISVNINHTTRQVFHTVACRWLVIVSVLVVLSFGGKEMSCGLPTGVGEGLVRLTGVMVCLLAAPHHCGPVLR